MGEYLKNDSWSKKAQKEFGALNEAPTIYGLQKLIEKGNFIEKKIPWPGRTTQELECIVLPREVYNYYVYLFDRNIDLDINKFGFFWFQGYPVLKRD